MIEAFAVLGLLFAGLFVGAQDSTNDETDDEDTENGLDQDHKSDEIQNEIEAAASLDITFLRASVIDFVAYSDDTDILEEGPTSVQGSDGSDHISVTGSGLEIVGRGGSDLVDIENAGSVLVWADEDDTVLGSNLEGDQNVSVVVSGSGTFFGGSSNELGIAVGSGGNLHGGGGDDTLESFGGASILFGGDGQDIIVSNQTNESFNGSDIMRTSDGTDYQSDSVFGGSGNDTILLSGLDIASGGSGSDSFVVYDDFSEGNAARITDFDKAYDKILIQLGESDAVVDENSNIDLFDQISVQEIDGDTVILNNGKMVTLLEGVIGVSVGVVLPETGLEQKFASLDGAIQPPSSFNVLVAKF